jgi:hypothetical protein
MGQDLAQPIGGKTTQKRIRRRKMQRLLTVAGLRRRMPLGTPKQRTPMQPDRIIYL